MNLSVAAADTESTSLAETAMEVGNEDEALAGSEAEDVEAEALPGTVLVTTACTANMAITMAIPFLWRETQELHMRPARIYALRTTC